ncbi:MAG: serine/threonine protein kinase, partial [Sedimentisphaerales bacterium]|nr:serine/threonine protein kinase [Sedimentisphaerales bacterium]
METENINPEDIFHKAIEIADTAEQAAYLNKACGENEKLRADVEELLKAHEQAGDFLDLPAVGPNATLENSPLTEGPGTKIGRYKLLQLIGEGGFGCVYMAEQEKPIRRKVALKIIKLGMDTRQVITRFEVERQALAMMDHPNIARVFDAGATDTGRPYFVMELVKGVPITEYCDKNNLSTRQRLELFVDVCKAVQHAHQKGIIHRDIKPSNVMITLQDGKPMPKIIDFGIAKATQHRLTEKTFFTEYRQFIGTPEYMSPEQAEMSALDIDTRTDIYSLGVLLYELLTGVTPFDAKQLREVGYAEIQRIIRETEPLKPSTKLSTMGDALNDVAKHRHMQPGELCKIVRGDLDWVVMKAMEKDRTRRYETANELAADISRHIADEPVSAGPPSARYRLRKFVRRNRALVTGITAVLAVLVAGIVVSTLFAVGQARARARAEFHAAMLHGTMELFQNGFFVKGADVTVGEAVETLAKNLELGESIAQSSDLSLDEYYGVPLPLMAAATHLALGNMYVGLDKYEKAEPHLERAYQFFQKELGQKHEVTVHAVKDLALLYLRQDRYNEAEPLLAKVLETSRRMRGDHHDKIMLYEMNELARRYIEEHRYNEAEPVLVEALDISRRVLGEQHENTLWAIHYLGDLYRSQGRYDKAEPLLVKALEISRRTLGEENLSTTGNMWCLGMLYTRQGRYDEAEPLLVESLNTIRHMQGEENRQASAHMDALGVLYAKQGRYDEAEPLLVKAVEVRRRLLGEENPLVLEFINDQAVLYREQGRYKEAEDLFSKSLNTRRRVLGEKHPDTLTSESDLAFLYLKQGRYDESEPLALNCYQGRSAKFGMEHVFTQD